MKIIKFKKAEYKQSIAKCSNCKKMTIYDKEVNRYFCASCPLTEREPLISEIYI